MNILHDFTLFGIFVPKQPISNKNVLSSWETGVGLPISIGRHQLKDIHLFNQSKQTVRNHVNFSVDLLKEIDTIQDQF